MSKSLHAFALGTLKNGALEERVYREIQRVIENIRDPNTQRDTVRKIEIKLAFKPAEDRTFASVTAKVETKLAGATPLQTFAMFEESDGELFAVEPIGQSGDDPRQTEIDTSANVTPIKRKDKSS